MTRMWMVDPKIMCRQHLLGEHFETHVIATNIGRGRSIAGFIRNNAIEPRSVEKRHDELVEEMERRGMKHRSPLKFSTEVYPDFKIDREASLKLLLGRCPRCAERKRSMEKGVKLLPE
jgi:Pyrimidine dimer DNA glycosylase